ncbi:trypsin-like peptidase domain-containing protein [Paraburkholderia sp. HD33-4]|uniref:trypsin-like peptidase domain-containing protein n=1 Tax=Paraburkholderia sp. HD33-4 TaxID=2883242 RepID=UPI001F2C7CFB|nr:trypsin-like peptidase domain-containing protein [Paraburkholderia sp. HD33-4]
MRRDNLKYLLISQCLSVAVSTGCMAQSPPNTASSETRMPAVRLPNDGDAPAVVTDFSRLVNEEGNAVVHIDATAARPAAALTPLWPPAGSEDAPLPRLFGPFSAGAPGITDMPSQRGGSGFIVGADGDILTDSSVIAGATRVTVTLTDARQFKATVVGNDPASGVALLKIPAANLPTVSIGSLSGTKAGQWVASIGSPHGLNDTVTAGIISNMSRPLPGESYVPLIQTDMTENAGDAGSPVFSLNGNVIGMEMPVSKEIGDVGGLAFALPIDEAMKVAQQLRLHHEAEHGRLGITIEDVSWPLAQSFGLKKPEGALVSSVDPRGPAATSGLRPGDVIVKINGAAVPDSTQLPLTVADLTPGTSVRLAYWRDNAMHAATVTLGRLNAAADEPAAIAQATAPDGLTVRGLTAQERRDAGVESGVRVEKSTGAAALAGVEPGDIILMVDSTHVSSPAQFRQKAGNSGNAVALLVQRNGQRMFVSIDIG